MTKTYYDIDAVNKLLEEVSVQRNKIEILLRTLFTLLERKGFRTSSDNWKAFAR